MEKDYLKTCNECGDAFKSSEDINYCVSCRNLSIAISLGIATRKECQCGNVFYYAKKGE